jgi:hypothetical protein
MANEKSKKTPSGDLLLPKVNCKAKRQYTCGHRGETRRAQAASATLIFMRFTLDQWLSFGSSSFLQEVKISGYEF